jgi:hypothetical protein
MRDELIWSILVLIWVFGWAAVWLVRKRAHDAQNLRLREMLHRERLTAIEAGVPLPEIPDLEEPSPWIVPETVRLWSVWMRRLSLFLGLVCAMTGAGICAAFYWAPDRGFHEMWTIGLIPIMAGFGFLIFCSIVPVVDREPVDRPPQS